MRADITSVPETAKSITVKQVRSAAGRFDNQEATLIGLGLNKINRQKTVLNTPNSRGRIRTVAHLVEIIGWEK